MQIQMKKIFAILALTAIMASCNDGGGAGEQKGDSTAAPTQEAAPVDSGATVSPDTTSKVGDTTAKKTDSIKK
jgi:predicted small secreted protein